MEATTVALLFGAATVVSGKLLAMSIDPADPPEALGACTALACLIVMGVTAASVVTFTPSLIAFAWVVLAISGARRRTTAVRIPGVVSARTGLLFLTALAALVPMLVLPVPLDTDAQGFGLLALAIRDGGTIDTLSPWRPDIAYLYSPGALVIFAAVSVLFFASMPAAMMGVSHAAVVLLVWLAWELGDELSHQSRTDDPAEDIAPANFRWAASVSAALSVGTWTALLDSHYTAVLGLLFVVATVTALLRFVRIGRRADWLAAVASTAGVLITHVDSAMILAFGFLSLAFAGWLGRPRATPQRWFAAVVGVPLCATLVVAPWLWSVWRLLGAGIRSPFVVDPSHWRQMVVFHGVAWPLLAMVGAFIWIRRRRAWAIAMTIWLLVVVESTMLGSMERAFPALTDLVLQFHYPYSVAWHGPTVPYLALGAGAIVWMLNRMNVRSLSSPGTPSLVAAAVAAGVVVVFADSLLSLSKPGVSLYGAFASENDLRAMRWIRDHAPLDARVLNYPGDYEHRRDWEAHWAPVVTERDCVYFRMQPFYAELPVHQNGDGSRRGLADALAEQQSMLTFWRDPADLANRKRLRDAGIDFVLVPESIGDGSSLARAWRWRPPARVAEEKPDLDRATYLELAYHAGGARVYTLAPASTGQGR